MLQHHNTADLARSVLRATIKGGLSMVTHERVGVMREDAAREIGQYRNSAAQSWVEKDRHLERARDAIVALVEDAELRKSLAAAIGVLLPDGDS